MLVVMEFERFLRHVGLQRIVGVGQFGQGERHRRLLGFGWKARGSRPQLPGGLPRLITA